MKPRAARAPTPLSDGRNRWLTIGEFALILLAVIVAYLPALRAGFVWDDEQLITANPLLRSLSGLWEIWTGSRTPDYFPVTNTVFWLEAQLFGEHAAGYHVVNVLLHAVNAILVWKVLERLKIPGAFVAGLIFGIHPVHAESVAWISELKNVLSMFFYLISLLCFFEAEDGKLLRPSIAYACSVVSFVLALLSKTQIVFAPVVLLLCLWWRSTRTARDLPKRRKQSTPTTRALVESWITKTSLFFLIALIFGLITIWFQNRGIGEEEIALGSLPRRLVNTGLAMWWYAKQVFAPFRLMAVYPPWRFDSPSLIEWLPLGLLLIVVASVWWRRNRGAAPYFFAVAYFIIALLPVVGLVRLAYVRSGTLVADHLQYFADISLIALFSAGVTRLLALRQTAIRISTVAVVLLLVTAMAGYSWTRASVYRDEETLWRDNLSKNPDAWQGHNRIGQIFFNQNKFQEAAEHFERAAQLKPELAGNHNSLGLAYCRLDRFEEGIGEYRKALQLNEETPSTANTSSTATIRTNLANALTITANNLSERAQTLSDRELAEADTKQAMARYQEAISEYEKALAIQPEHPAIHRNLGILLARLGKTDEAIVHLRKVLELVPNEPLARETLTALEADRR